MEGDVRRNLFAAALQAPALGLASVLLQRGSRRNLPVLPVVAARTVLAAVATASSQALSDATSRVIRSSANDPLVVNLECVVGGCASLATAVALSSRLRLHPRFATQLLMIPTLWGSLQCREGLVLWRFGAPHSYEAAASAAAAAVPLFAVPPPLRLLLAAPLLLPPIGDVWLSARRDCGCADERDQHVLHGRESTDEEVLLCDGLLQDDVPPACVAECKPDDVCAVRRLYGKAGDQHGDGAEATAAVIAAAQEWLQVSSTRDDCYVAEPADADAEMERPVTSACTFILAFGVSVGVGPRVARATCRPLIQARLPPCSMHCDARPALPSRLVCLCKRCPLFSA